MIDRFLLNEDNIVIDPNASEEELEKQKDEYDQQYISQQKKSDDEAIAKYGKTNKEIYNDAKSKYLKEPIKDDEVGEISADSPVSESDEFMDAPKKEYYIKKYTDSDIRAVINWSLDSNINIITPAESLEKLEDMWIKFNSMVTKHRRVSDWKCVEVFGINNQDFYEYQKSYFLAMQKKLKDFETVSKEDIVTNTILSKAYDTALDKVLDVEKSIKESGVVLESSDIQNSLRIISNDDKDSSAIEPFNIADSDIFPVDLPFYTPYELDDIGVYSGENNRCYPISDSNLKVGKLFAKEWFEAYKLLSVGIKCETYNSADWVTAVRGLMYKKNFLEMNNSNEDEINKINQSILELGWNPYLEFTLENRIAAKNRVLSTLQLDYNDTFINLTEYYKSKSADCYSILMESAKKKGLKPVYIILIEGDTPLMSKAIIKITKGPFSHAAICLDDDFKKLYSFAMFIKGKKGTGLSYEDIRDYPSEGELGVYAIFVKEADYKKIEENLEYYIDHIDDTKYSLFKCAMVPLHIKTKTDMNMFCSMFVDNLLKLCDIDITSKASSLVGPNDFYRASILNKKIYKIYEGKVKDFDADEASKLSKKISKTAEAIKESVAYLMNYNIPYTMKSVLNPVLEVKDTPIKLDKDGNIFIKSLKWLNPEAEYQESHKLLLNYENTKNYKGIKSELCRLWFLNNYLESRINSGKKNIDEYTKIRARVLNDFNKYIKMVCSHENDFNFKSYFDDSPYSDAYIRINNDSIKGSFKLLKDILV